MTRVKAKYFAGAALSFILAGGLAGCTAQTGSGSVQDISISGASGGMTGGVLLPDTGQSIHYDIDGNELQPIQSSLYTGQDASVHGNPLRYRDNGDGTVTDLNTGLMWQKAHDLTRRDLADTAAFVETMDLAGYTDWRMPTIKELYSLGHFDGQLTKPGEPGERRPYLDRNYFDFEYDRRLPFAGQFWSSTVYNKSNIQNETKHSGLQGAFGFNFADGHIKAYESGLFFDGTEIMPDDNMFVPGCYVRAVRGTTSLFDMDYHDNGDGTVTDRSTGLMWAKDDSGTRMDWVDALEYAHNSDLAGHSDWRLPNTKELQSLVDYDKADFPALDTAVFNTSVTNFDSQDDSYFVWTSTTLGDFKWTANYISFGQAWSKKNSSATQYYDWHGAGAQRSDPKRGRPADYEMASDMAADYVSIQNWVRLVRDAP